MLLTRMSPRTEDERRPHDRVRDTGRGDVVLDLRLAAEVRQLRAGGIRDADVDDTADAGLPRGLEQHARVRDRTFEGRLPVGEADPVGVVERVDSVEARTSAARSRNCSCARSIRSESGSAGASRRVSVRTSRPRRSNSSAIARPVYENAPVTASITRATDGSAAITSLAIIPGCGRLRAASPCAAAAAAAARRGSRPFARKAATMPVRTSPVPAVADQASSATKTSTPASGEATIVSAPLSRQTQPKRSAARRTASSRCAFTHADSSPSSRASSPACGVSTARGPHSPGSSSCSASASSTTACAPAASSSARSDAASPLRPRPGPIARAAAFGGVVAPPPTDLDGLEQLRLDDGERAIRHGDGDVARVGTERRPCGQARGSRSARSAADHEHRACRVLVVFRPLARDEREDRRRDQLRRRHDRLEPDVGDDDLARVEETRRDDEPDLAAVEGDGQRLPGRPRPRPPRSKRRRRRARRPRRPSAPAALIRSIVAARLLARPAVETGSEECIDDHVRLLHGRRLDRVAALLAEDARGDPPVAAVRAAAADDGDPARVGNRCITSRATAAPARSISSPTSCPSSAALASSAV